MLEHPQPGSRVSGNCISTHSMMSSVPLGTEAHVRQYRFPNLG